MGFAAVTPTVVAAAADHSDAAASDHSDAVPPPGAPANADGDLAAAAAAFPPRPGVNIQPRLRLGVNVVHRLPHVVHRTAMGSGVVQGHPAPGVTPLPTTTTRCCPAAAAAAAAVATTPSAPTGTSNPSTDGANPSFAIFSGPQDHPVRQRRAHTMVHAAQAVYSSDTIHRESDSAPVNVCRGQDSIHGSVVAVNAVAALPPPTYRRGRNGRAAAAAAITGEACLPASRASRRTRGNLSAAAADDHPPTSPAPAPMRRPV